MKTQEILHKYIAFFKNKGHKEGPNVSLIPEGDSTLLFVNSGMFPLVPYLCGEPHPLGSRVTNVQRAVRFEDIDEIGDPRHTLAFHMLGNWSFGDYFKEEQLSWLYAFLVDELGLEASRLYATVFDGDADAPRDEESIEILQNIFSRYGISAELNKRIFPYGKKSNWWQRGDAVGELGGPDSEVFYYLGDGEPTIDPENDEENFLEIGNSVFLQYKRTETGWEELPQKNVDFGGGLERIALVVQGKQDIFETDNFWPIVEKIQELSGKDYNENEETKKHMRIVADHMRASVFLAMDGVVPGNKDQGYGLRRLLRRIVRYGRLLGVEKDISVNLVGIVCDLFSWLYPELPEKAGEIEKLFSAEEKKARELYTRVSKKVRPFVENPEEEQMGVIFENGGELLEAGFISAERMSAGWAKLGFDFHQSDGYALDDFFEDLEIAKKTKGLEVVDISEVKRIAQMLVEQHQQTSRAGAEQKFKGGLADHSDTVVKYHTATHLLRAGLKKVLGDHVSQIGSNITGDRLRFDFTHGQKLTPEELKQVEAFVNSAKAAETPVNYVMMSLDEAKKTGASYLENENYPNPVKLYYVGDSLEEAISREFCGGPHVENTAELDPIEIYKQDKIGEGKMRVYARFVG